MRSFEEALSSYVEMVELTFGGHPAIAWSPFLLNPRRLRGSDFLMRWSQGVWSEERLTEAVNQTGKFFALPYGPSGTAPNEDVRAFELYFERLEAAGLGGIKRPDLLMFRKSDERAIEKIVGELGGISELPFTPETEQAMREILSHAIVAVECENSLWKAQLMPDYGAALKPQRRLGGKLGLKKSAVLPTIILKEEDRSPLQRWQEESQVPIHIWHVFYDLAFGIALDEAGRLIQEGYIQPTEQTFQAPGGATTKKLLYKLYHHYAYPLGVAKDEPILSAKHIIDKNGHILPYVHFEGGRMELSADALNILWEMGDGP